MGRPNFKDKAIASKAGAKSKPGPHKKTIEWNEFGFMVSSQLIDDVIEAIKKKPLDERIQLLMQLLNYFKPKLSSQEIKADIKTEITDAITKAFDWTDEAPDEAD